MYRYLQNTATNTCNADVSPKLINAFKGKKPVVFHAQEQSLINNKPIEKISHHIWLSKHVDNGKSKEMSEKDFQSLLVQFTKMDKDNPNFKHIVWINDEDLIPFTVQRLQVLGNVELKNIDSLQSEISSLSIIKDKLENGIYGVAIDDIKYEVVRIFGGIVLDLNYNITTNNNLSDVLNAYSFVTSGSIDGNNLIFENSIIAASRDHPILQETCELISGLLSSYTIAAANRGQTDHFYKLFSEAVHNNLDPYKEQAPEEIINKEGRANFTYEELIGIDYNSESWIHNA